MLNRGIVIGASEFTRPYFEELIKSIKTNYPIYVCWEGLGREVGSFEIGAIEAGSKIFDEFIFIHDTTLIKDNEIFDRLFNTEGHVFITEGMYHYMGKFASNDLPVLPKVTNKTEAIQQELHWFNKPYSIMENPLPVHTKEFEEKYGQRRMRLECPSIIKWKGTFHI